MEIIELKFYIDCDVKLILGTSEEFEKWYEDNKTQKSSKLAKFTHGGCGFIKKQRSQFVWINTEDEILDQIGTLAHESSHYVDHLEDFLSSSENERIPGELRARMIQTLVRKGTEIILKERVK